MNTLRGGVLRDVYALIYQLEHDARRKGEVKISIGYIGERLGYSNQRNVQRAIAELKEMGWLEVEYGNGKRSIFKTHTPAKIAPPTEGENPCQISTPDKLAPLLNQHHTHANMTPPTPYISKDNRLDNTTTTTRAHACERLKKWIAESEIKEWAELQFTRNGMSVDLDKFIDEFYDNDFKVRERCENNERMEVLTHFQYRVQKHIREEREQHKNENNNGNNRTNNSPTTGNSGQRTVNLNGIAQSILAGCEAGRNRRQ